MDDHSVTFYTVNTQANMNNQRYMPNYRDSNLMPANLINGPVIGKVLPGYGQAGNDSQLSYMTPNNQGRQYSNNGFSQSIGSP